MSPRFEDTILKHFSGIEDPRIDRTKQHLLRDIIAIAILAVLSGADAASAIETYAQAKQEWLQEFLALPNGIPSHDTIASLRRLPVRALRSAQSRNSYFNYATPLRQTIDRNYRVVCEVYLT